MSSISYTNNLFTTLNLVKKMAKIPEEPTISKPPDLKVGKNIPQVLHKRSVFGSCHVPSELLYMAEEAFIFKTHKETPCKLPDIPRSTFLMVFSPDGTKVASTHGNHNVYITELSTKRNVRTLSGHPRTPWCIAFHPSSNQILASGCLGGQVRVWDLHGGSEIWMTESQTVIASLAFHPTDRLLVIASYNEVLFWDWSQPEPFAKSATNNDKEKVRFVAFDPLGHKLLTGVANAPPRPESQWNRGPAPPLVAPPPAPPEDSLHNDYERRIIVCYRFMVQQYEQLVQRYRLLVRARSGASSVTDRTGSDGISGDNTRRRTQRNSFRRFTCGHPLPPRNLSQSGSNLSRNLSQSRLRPILRFGERRPNLALRNSANRIRNNSSLNLTPPAEPHINNPPLSSGGTLLQQFESEITESLARLHRNIRRMRIHGIDMPWGSTSNSGPTSASSSSHRLSIPSTPLSNRFPLYISSDSSGDSDMEAEQLSRRSPNSFRNTLSAVVMSGADRSLRRSNAEAARREESTNRGNVANVDVTNDGSITDNTRNVGSNRRSRSINSRGNMDVTTASSENVNIESIDLDDMNPDVAEWDHAIRRIMERREGLASSAITTSNSEESPTRITIVPSPTNPWMERSSTDALRSNNVDDFRRLMLNSRSSRWLTVSTRTPEEQQPQPTETTPSTTRTVTMVSIGNSTSTPQSNNEVQTDADSTNTGIEPINVTITTAEGFRGFQPFPAEPFRGFVNNVTGAPSLTIRQRFRNNSLEYITRNPPASISFRGASTPRIAEPRSVFEMSNAISNSTPAPAPSETTGESDLTNLSSDMREFFKCLYDSYRSPSRTVLLHSLHELNRIERLVGDTFPMRGMIMFATRVYLAAVLCRARILHLQRLQINELYERISRDLNVFSLYPDTFGVPLETSRAGLQFFSDLYLNEGLLIEPYLNTLDTGNRPLLTPPRATTRFTEARATFQRLNTRHNRWITDQLDTWMRHPSYVLPTLRSSAENERMFRRDMLTLSEESSSHWDSDRLTEMRTSYQSFVHITIEAFPHDNNVPVDALQDIIIYLSTVLRRAYNQSLLDPILSIRDAETTRTPSTRNSSVFDTPLITSDEDSSSAEEVRPVRPPQPPRPHRPAPRNEDRTSRREHPDRFLRFLSARQNRFLSRHRGNRSSSDEGIGEEQGEEDDDDDNDDDDEPVASTSQPSASELLRRMRVLADAAEANRTPPSSVESSSFTNILQSVRDFITQLETLADANETASVADTPFQPIQPQPSTSSESTASATDGVLPPVQPLPCTPSTSTGASTSTSSQCRKRKSAPSKLDLHTTFKRVLKAQQLLSSNIRRRGTRSASSGSTMPKLYNVLKKHPHQCQCTNCKSSNSPPDWFKIAIKRTQQQESISSSGDRIIDNNTNETSNEMTSSGNDIVPSTSSNSDTIESSNNTILPNTSTSSEPNLTDDNGRNSTRNVMNQSNDVEMFEEDLMNSTSGIQQPPEQSSQCTSSASLLTQNSNERTEITNESTSSVVQSSSNSTTPEKDITQAVHILSKVISDIGDHIASNDTSTDVDPIQANETNDETFASSENNMTNLRDFENYSPRQLNIENGTPDNTADSTNNQNTPTVCRYIGPYVPVEQISSVERNSVSKPTDSSDASKNISSFFHNVVQGLKLNSKDVSLFGWNTIRLRDSRNTTSTLNDSINMASTSNNSTNMASTSNNATSMTSTSNNSTNVASTSNISTNIASTSKDSTNMASTSINSTNIASTLNDSTNMTSTSNNFTNLASTSNNSTNIASTSNESTNTASTSNDSTNMASTPNKRTISVSQIKFYRATSCCQKESRRSSSIKFNQKIFPKCWKSNSTKSSPPVKSNNKTITINIRRDPNGNSSQTNQTSSRNCECANVTSRCSCTSPILTNVRNNIGGGFSSNHDTTSRRGVSSNDANSSERGVSSNDTINSGHGASTTPYGPQVSVVERNNRTTPNNITQTSTRNPPFAGSAFSSPSIYREFEPIHLRSTRYGLEIVDQHNNSVATSTRDRQNLVNTYFNTSRRYADIRREWRNRNARFQTFSERAVRDRNRQNRSNSSCTRPNCSGRPIMGIVRRSLVTTGTDPQRSQPTLESRRSAGGSSHSTPSSSRAPKPSRFSSTPSNTRGVPSPRSGRSSSELSTQSHDTRGSLPRTPLFRRSANETASSAPTSTSSSPIIARSREEKERLERARSQARNILSMMLRHISNFFRNANLDIPSANNQEETANFHERVYNLHILLQLVLHLTELLYAQLSRSRHQLVDNLRSGLNSVSYLNRYSTYLRHRQSRINRPRGGIQVPVFRRSRQPVRLTRDPTGPVFQAISSSELLGLHNVPISTISSGTVPIPEVLVNGAPASNPGRRTPSPTSPPTFRPRLYNPRIHNFDGLSDDPDRELRNGFSNNVFLMRGAYGPNSVLVPDSYYSPHHRIQTWDFSKLKIPNLRNPEKNLVVKECKIHNDASVDISQDGQILVTLLPSGRLSVTTKLGVYSLNWDTLGQCLYTTSFEMNAVSVSLSPTSRHLIVGLASRRVSLSTFSDTHTVAQLFRLEGGLKDPEEKRKLTQLRHIELPRDTGYMSLNCIRWAPTPGQGLVYGTNTGLLRILE